MKTPPKHYNNSSFYDFLIYIFLFFVSLEKFPQKIEKWRGEKPENVKRELL